MPQHSGWQMLFSKCANRRSKDRLRDADECRIFQALWKTRRTRPNRGPRLHVRLLRSATLLSPRFWPSWPSAVVKLTPVYRASYENQVETKLNLCILDVTTVVELDDHLRDIIKQKAESELGMKVVLRERIDKSILGGIIMSAGDKRIDASVASQLNNARIVLKKKTDGGEC